MAVYVDPLLPCVPNAQWRWHESCYLIADTVAESHAFAQGVGMRRAWFQRSRKGMPHYDLTRGRRQKAIRAGAIQLTRAQFAARVRQELKI